jgi:hypothetical protein
LAFVKQTYFTSVGLLAWIQARQLEDMRMPSITFMKAHTCQEDVTGMKNRKPRQHEKVSVFEATGGTCSARKIPQWRAGQTDIQAYLALLSEDWGDPVLNTMIPQGTPA